MRVCLRALVSSAAMVACHGCREGLISTGLCFQYSHAVLFVTLRRSTSAQTVPKPQAKTRQKATRLPAVTTKDSVTPALQNDQHPANIFQESHETQGVVRPRDNDDAAAYADDEAVSGKASIASTASRSTQTATLEKRSDEHAKQKRKPKRRLTRIDRTCERGPSPASTASKVAETECGARSQEVSNLVKSPIDELEALRNENNALRMQLLETQLHLRQEQVSDCRACQLALARARMSAAPCTTRKDDTVFHWLQVRMQMEFYLSDTNVVKDVFLQRHMDEFGFVPLEVYVRNVRQPSSMHNTPKLSDLFLFGV